MKTSHAVRDAAKNATRPTAAQAEAGNYHMGHVRIQGMEIAIETPRGRSRKAGWPRMAAHYGYIKGTVGKDKDHVDVFIGPTPESQLVVVVDQLDESGNFDEHKVLVGFTTEQAAVAAYRKCYSADWTVGPVTSMTIGQFKAWLKDGTQNHPIADQVSRYAADGEKWITTDNGSHVLLDGSGKVAAGMGGKFNGKVLGSWDRSEKSEPEKTEPTPKPANEQAERVKQWNKNATAIRDDHAQSVADAKSHPLHLSKLEDSLKMALLQWHQSANETVQGVARAGSVAGTNGTDAAKAKKDAWEGHTEDVHVEPWMQKLRESVGKPATSQVQHPGVNQDDVKSVVDRLGKILAEHPQVAPFVKHNNLVPRELAAKMKPNDNVFHPVEDHERFAMAFGDAMAEHYAARQSKNSPGQMGLFGGPGKPELLRSGATQKKLNWDESKHPRAPDGRFGDKAGESRKTTGKDGPSDAEAKRKTLREYWAKIGEEQEVERKKKAAKNKPEAETPKDDAKPGDLVGDDDETGKAPSPRDNASSATKSNQADYDFARSSAVGNAGEDLSGSARHKRNAWRSLEESESDGSAEQLVTRDKLLRNEPHTISDHIDDAPRKALAMHLAMKAMPVGPRVRRRSEDDAEAKKQARREYLDAYREIKTKAEELAASPGDDYFDATNKLRKIISNHIDTLRKGNRYNHTANQLVDTHNSLTMKRSGVLVKVKTVLVAAGDSSASGFEDKLKDMATSVLEGKSIAAATGTKKSKKNAFSPVDAYVAHAERVGGPKASFKDAAGATDYMIDKVNLRGVQFGNSVTDKEREHHATMAATALLDLADVTGLPVEAISLNGKLGLAMGARGRGGALAHYEPSSKVINLTRKSGVGSLAHEWAHAFDHEMGGGDVDLTSHGMSGTYQSDKQGVSRMGQMVDGVWKSTKTDNDATALGKPMAELRSVMSSSGFRARLATNLSNRPGMSHKQRSYWSSSIEVFARCFERHVQRKLEMSDRKNTYLSGTNEKAYGENGLWPTNEESDKMAPAFDALMDAYRVDRLGVDDRAKYSASERHAFILEFYAASSSKPKTVVGSQGDKGHFVTIDGHPVFIESESGKVSRGPRGMKGKLAKSVPGKRLQKSKRIKSDRSGDRDSPGQLGAFDNGLGGNVLRSGETQSKLGLTDAFTPQSKVDKLIVDTVGADPDDVDHFRELMDDAHQMISTEAGETNDDLRQLLSNFGYSGKRTSQIVQAVRRTHGMGGDASMVNRFDEMVDMARNSYPQLLNTDNGESVGRGDDEHALWTRIKAGFEKLPSKTDDRVVELAKQMFDASPGSDHEYDPDFDMGDEWRDSTYDDVVPFAASFANAVVERYSAVV